MRLFSIKLIGISLAALFLISASLIAGEKNNGRGGGDNKDTLIDGSTLVSTDKIDR